MFGRESGAQVFNLGIWSFIPPIEITDVAATIFASLDIPIPGYMDGANFVKWN